MIDKNTIKQIIELVSDSNDSNTLISEVESLINNSLKFSTFDEYFIKGAYYTLDFTTLTLTSGALKLIKKP